MRQVVFTDMQITIRQRVVVLLVLGYVQSFAPIGLHKTDTASDWLLIKRHCNGMKGLPGVQLQNQSDYISFQHDFSITGKNIFYFN